MDPHKRRITPLTNTYKITAGLCYPSILYTVVEMEIAIFPNQVLCMWPETGQRPATDVERQFYILHQNEEIWTPGISTTTDRPQMIGSQSVLSYSSHRN